MILRAATDDDVAPIAKIIGDWCADTPYIPPLHTREEDQRFIQRVVKTQDVMVAENDGTVHGFIARDGQVIGQLYLAPDARGQGTGSTLLNAMKDRSDTLSLWCFQANTGARRFYESHGFTAAKFSDGAGNEESLPDINYVWSVDR